MLASWADGPSLRRMQKTDERSNRRELKPTDLRGILKYVPQWRHHVFVLALDGSVLEDESFANLMLEIAVLHNLGIRVVVVYGIGTQVQRLAEERGLTPTDTRGNGPTDRPTLDLCIEASGRVGHQIMQGLTHNGLKCAFVNAVRVTERGILRGVNQQFSGKVEKVDTEFLQHCIEREIVPVIEPVCFTREGAALRVNSDVLAADIALALKASKVIFVLPHNGLVIDGEFQLNVDVQMVEQILRKKPDRIDVEVRSKAEQAVRVIQGGTPRAHIIDSRIHDGLLTEIFSKVGVGSMIHSNPYAMIRRARKKDAGPIYSMTKSGVRNESLKQRTRQSIEREIGNYFVYEIDDSVIACARLIPYARTKTVELASVFVNPAYQGRSIGKFLVEYALEEAKKAGAARVVALTTQTYPFFKTVLGFKDGSIADIPAERRLDAEQNGRNSRVLVKRLR